MLFLASTIFALSCQCICDFVMFLSAFSYVINVQQFGQFLRFRNSSARCLEWNDVTYLWSQNDPISWGNTVVLCIVKWWRCVAESAGLRNVHIIAILLRKWCQNNKHFAELVPQNGGKTAGINMIWRIYVTVTLCICLSNKLILYRNSWTDPTGFWRRGYTQRTLHYKAIQVCLK